MNISLPMHLNSSTTEIVTAATNVPLAITALVAMTRLWRRREAQPLRAWLWIGMFGSLALGAGVGVFAHGLALDAAGRQLIWHPIRAALGLTIACFVGGAMFDWRGAAASRRSLPLLLLASAGFFGYATFWSNSFLPFILYEGLAMLFCLGIYAKLAAQARLRGAGWMVVGIATTILAAAIQAARLEVRVGVTFDHNGIFHLVQVPGLLCLLKGLQEGFESAIRKKPMKRPQFAAVTIVCLLTATWISCSQSGTPPGTAYAPMVEVLTAARNVDVAMFRDAYSARIRQETREADWGKNLEEARATTREKFGEYRLNDFTYSFEGDGMKGKLTLIFKGKKQFAIAVVKEEGVWKLDER